MKLLRNVVIYLIAAVFLLGLLPAASAADEPQKPPDNLPVLESLGHQDTDKNQTEFDSVNYEATLYVPFSYPADQLNLSDGLNFTYDTTKYKNVVASTAVLADIDGAAIDLTVSYNMIDSTDVTLKGTTIYSVTVKRAEEIAPTFSGTLGKEAKSEGSVGFLATDFLAFYTKNDGPSLRYISITGSNLNTCGTLKQDGVNYAYGAKIGVDEISKLTFNANKVTKVSSADYEVSAYAGLDPHPIKLVALSVTVYPAPIVTKSIAKEISKGAVQTFTAADFTNCADLFGTPLMGITITPTNTAYGTWYNGTKKISDSDTFKPEEISNLSFSASAPGVATFTWQVTTMAGVSDSGTGKITVTSPKITLYGPTAAPIFKGASCGIQAVSHAPDVPITYYKITTTPTSADGYLYLTKALPKDDAYGYPALKENTALPTNAIIPAAYLPYLRMATKSTSTKNQVTFMWAATADVKISSANWGDPAVYTVNFIQANAISYATNMNIPATFSATDFSAAFSYATGYSLSYVTFTLPNKNQGSLFLNYDLNKKTGTAVTAAGKYYAGKTPNLSNITFVPAKDFTGTATIAYTAYMDDTHFITGTVQVNVNYNAGGTVNYIIDKNSALQLDAKDFQAAFFSATGKNLSYITFASLNNTSSSHGTLYYNYTPTGDYDAQITSSYDHYYVSASSQYLSLVSFVPDPDFTGTVEILFYGYTGESYAQGQAGKLIINIVDSPAGIVSYTMMANGAGALTGSDFSDEFLKVTGSILSTVSFSPPATATGTLYYQYNGDTKTGTKVASSTKYTDGKNPDISELTFIPAKDLTGVVTIPFTATSVNGVSYAGKLKFIISDSLSVVSYTTESGKPVLMKAADFMNSFYMNSGGKTLSYVTFSLPATSYGKFYYNYTSSASYDSVVTGDRKYYVSSSPYLFNVSFVPQESYTGAVTVAYTGYASDGESFTGKIKLTVKSAYNGTVTYSTNSATPVAFRAADFVSAFTGKSANSLYYVRFTQPNSAYGTLYAHNAQVSSYTNYYVNSSSYISDVTFVPNPGFDGAAAVSYTAYDTYGNAYAGTVVITVKGGELGTITYGTDVNTPVQFNGADFGTAFSSKTGAQLSYVTFTGTYTSSGTLYLGYNTTAQSTVVIGAKYYRSYAPLLSNITFVPYSGYSGTVTISYTATAADNGPSYSGKIVINVGIDAPFTDLGAPYDWARDAISYLYRNGIITTGGNAYYPGADMTRGEFMMMIVNAFHLQGAGTDNFSDVPSGSYYYDAISDAKAAGIARGADDGLFHPESGLTRQDAMVIIVRAIHAVGKPLYSGTAGDLSYFSDASQVTSYAVSDVASLVRSGLVQGSGGKLYPLKTFTRAEASMLLYNILKM